MTGEERREGILERIRQAKAPVAARALAELYGVSRQVIVQDIALIRASGHEIFSFCRRKDRQSGFSRCAIRMNSWRMNCSVL